MKAYSRSFAAAACAAALLLAGMLLASAPASAMDAPAAPLKLAYFPNKVVMYPHAAHAKLECKQCHHKLDAAGNPQKCSAKGCHDVFDKKDKSEKSFYRIVHDTKLETMQSCLMCHKAEGAKLDKAAKKALTGCAKSRCHP